MKPSLHLLTAVTLPIALAACGSAQAPRAGTPSLQGPEPAARGLAYERVMEATSCWMGGMWSDARGEKGGARLAGIQGRCDEFLASNAEPEESYFPLRALDRETVDRLAWKIQSQASEDPSEAPRATDLVVLFRAIADAARETVEARRAADVVKEDVTQQPQVWVRNANKEGAASKLAAFSACRELLHANGPYAAEAHGAGMLFAIDRMEIARGLPKHLKILAVRSAFVELFGVPAPALPADAAAPIPTGTWLVYLSDAATASGHPLPADAHNPQNMEPLAWTGVLDGMADRLAAEAVRLPPASQLGDVEKAVVARLDEQYENERAVFEAHAPRDR